MYSIRQNIGLQGVKGGVGEDFNPACDSWSPMKPRKDNDEFTIEPLRIF